MSEHSLADTSDSLREKNRTVTLRRAEKAQKVVEHLGVKLHRFLPSSTEIWTVVGSDRDFLIDCDVDSKRKDYCSCDDFYFRVLSGKIPECYHLTAARKAMKDGLYSVVEFSDDEMQGFLTALLSDIFANVS